MATLRQHDNLFDDEDNIIYKIINIRRKNTQCKGERWEIFEDDEMVLEMKGYRFTKKEKQFLRTPDGVKTVMKLYKDGNHSVSKIKKGINLEINDYI